MTARPAFYSRPWQNPLNDQGWQDGLVGTCAFQWRATETAYEILTIINDVPGNGDFAHTLDWFYESCQRDKRNLVIREIWNKRLQAHLLKRGFSYAENDDMIKYF